MGPLISPAITYQVWDVQGLTREVARLNTEMKALHDYTIELAHKHNFLLNDTSNAMGIIESGMQDHDGIFGETNRKLNIVELALSNHDQIIQSNDPYII